MKITAEVAGKHKALTYQECREYAAKYQQANPETHSAVRIVKDGRGGWKCRITMH